MDLLRGILLFSLPVAAVSACRPNHEFALAQPNAVLFANGVWPTTELKVCWEFKNETTLWFTTEFSNVVAKAFERTKLNFSGWDVCPRETLNTDIRIFIYDDPLAEQQEGFADVRKLMGTSPDRGHPRVPHPGPHMRPYKANVILNLSGLDSDPFLGELYSSLSPTGKRNLALSSSLHELGHAIGLRHENSHPENTCVGYNENLEWGDNVVGSYNPGSFMQRCLYRNFDYDKGLVWPNDQDIAGINKIYL